MGLGRVTSNLFIHTNLHQTNRQVGQYNVGAPLVLGQARGNVGLTRLTMAWTRGKPPPSPIQYTLHLSARTTSKWVFVSRFPKGNLETTKVGTPATLQGHNFVHRPLIGMTSKSKLQLLLRLSNSVSHATCTDRGRVDSRLFVVGRQITSLIPDLSFCHNLCCRCPNGSCKPFQTSKLQQLSNDIENSSM